LVNGQVKASNVTPPQGKIMYPSNYVTGLPWSRDFGRYKGAVDEVRLWNTARSTTEIARDYKQVLGGQETGLLAYWRFESINGTGVTPATGNSGLSATVGGNPDTHALVTGVNTDPTAQTSVVTWTAMPGGQSFTGNTISVSPIQSTTYTVTRSDLACSIPIAISVVQAPCNLTAVANSYSIVAGSPVSLWIEGTPFNSSNALYTNQGLTFTPSSQPQSLTGTFTWEAWVKPDVNLSGDNTNERYVLYPRYDGARYNSNYAGLGVAAGKDGIRLVGHTANYLQQILDYRTPITDWTHVAVVFQNNVATLLIDGVAKVSNLSPPQNKIIYPYNYITGVPDGEYGRYWGAIDEVRLWNTARSTTDIARDYKRLLTGQEAGLLSYWQFESIADNKTQTTGTAALSAALGGSSDSYKLVSGVNTATAIQTDVVSWTALPGGQTFTGNTIAVTPAKSTTYVVSRSSNPICTTSVGISVGILPCSFSLVASATPTSLSCGSPVSLSVAPSGPVSATAGTITYAWSGPGPDSLMSYTQSGQSFTTVPASATTSAGVSTTYTSTTGISTVATSGSSVATYSVTATQGFCTTSSSVSVVLTGAPSLTVSSPQAIYREGESLTLTAAMSSTVAGPIVYDWTGPNSYTGTGQKVTVPKATTAMAGSYTVVATIPSGCTISASLSLSVVPSSFTCTCQDCDLPAVKDTENPPVAASNRGSSGQNFVQESVYLDAGGSSVSQTISYFDGLGRPIQKVNVATGGKTTGTPVADIVVPMAYDAFGREPIKYLPYADATNNGAFRPSAVGSVSGYYTGLPDKAGNAFSTSTFEASPLNRVLTKTAPGSNMAMQMAYRTNSAGELPLLTYDFSSKTISVSNYAAGQLYVTESTDENGDKTIEYKDKEERVVGKVASGRTTLYAYDDFGWLRCVVPPKSSAALTGSFDPFAGDLLFGYDYDTRGRMTQKKVPGAGVMIMTYDARDRLITSTDANGTTITTDYDELDRVIATKKGGVIQTQTFYDTYGGEAKGFDSAHAYSIANKTDHLKGMVTSTKMLILGESTPGTGAYLTSSTYYDNLGRGIQTVSENHKGGLDRSSSKLDYIGRSIENKLSTLNDLLIENRTAYDAGSRIKTICQRVTDGVTAMDGSVGQYWEPIARHSYNGIGELTRKTLGCGIQNIDYTYQMRGWLTKINDPADLNIGFLPADKHYFGMKLAYDPVGNITNWDYRMAQRKGDDTTPYEIEQSQPFAYGFSYDNLNRIQSGKLTQQGQAVFALDGLTYDENGNITSLKRTFQGALVDNLSYTYKNGGNSNQLGSVTDAGSNPGTPNAFFKDGTANYTYDANGNLITDSGKGITGIDYNYLNLPSTIHKTGGDVTYTYTTSGQKLKADFGSGKVYNYVAGLVYDKDGLEFIPTAEGRLLPPGRASTTLTVGSADTATNAFYRYEYHLKDHLGNLRIACRCGEKEVEADPSDTQTPLVVQENHYDPFGLDLTGLNSQPGLTASRFKFNGKEQQQGLGWIDYGARMYDPAIGRWNGVDPLAEKYYSHSPYLYGLNDPILFHDIDGRDIDLSHFKGKAEMNALRNLLRTKVGYAFFAQFATARLKITIGKDVFIFKNAGQRAKDVLVLASTRTENMIQAGGDALTRTYERNNSGKDYGFGVNLQSADMNTRVEQGVIHLINQDEEQGEESITNNIAHEATVHVNEDVRRLNELNQAVNNGTIKPGSVEYIKRLQYTGASALVDHAKIAEGKVKQYINITAELDKLKGGNTYQKLYEADVKRQSKDLDNH
jgi:RHS repeat-associated protein